MLIIRGYGGWGVPLGLVEQFIEFLEQAPNPSVPVLSRRVLLKCRDLTGAEAGTVFIVRGRGRLRRLEAVAVQNDVVRTDGAAFTLPVTTDSIAGYVAATGETVFEADAYAIDPSRPYRFNQELDERTGFRTRSILAFALKGYKGRPVGVVQLFNRRAGDGEDGQGGGAFLPGHGSVIAPVNHLVGRALERALTLERLSEQNRELRRQRARVTELQAETERALMVSVRLLARAAEIHDEDTGNHILRVNEYSHALAQLAGQGRAFCDTIRYSAALHDVGKMSVDHAILSKRGPLDEREQAEMRRHPEYGYEILIVSDRLQMAADIALNHHEQWDGGGYPRRVAGTDIPLSARIVALADCYDALRSRRAYKPAFTHERTVEILTHGDERLNPAAHFDPHLLTLFCENHGLFAEIWESLKDRTKE